MDSSHSSLPLQHHRSRCYLTIVTVYVTLSKAKDILAFVGIVNIACLNRELVSRLLTNSDSP
jgi:hypothetical protein